MNQKIFEVFFGFSRHNSILDAVFVFLAKFLPYLLTLGFLVLIFYKSSFRRRLFFYIEAALALILGSGLLVQFFRFFYHHPRPFEEIGFTPLIAPPISSSFPSNHAAILFALSLLIFYLNRRLGIWFFILSFLNGLARVVVGVHWPLDILGGALVGVLSAFLIHRWLDPLAKKV
ncbi:MAG: phosphatase PAP2 family protein [Candidatus Liptonbacteria bacterium]|nr:phosphatase PAP2 family protein [Candidatus Liptonbacteria bacterium]